MVQEDNMSKDILSENKLQEEKSQKLQGLSDEKLVWEEVSTEHIVQDEWIDFRRSKYRFPDGTEFEPYYSYSRRNYVVIVASDEDGNYLCVRQYRQGIGEVTTEFPAGGIEVKDVIPGSEDSKARTGAGDKVDTEDKEGSDNPSGIKVYELNSTTKDALDAAKRELKEETGYESDEWRHLLTVPSNATIADNYAFIFEAKNCRKSSDQHLDDTEFLDVLKHTPAEIEELVSKGQFQQAVHVLAWLLSERSER